MLAVFDRSVAKSPDGLRTHGEGEGAALLAQQFASTREGAVAVNLGAAGAVAYSAERQNPLLPRLFAVVDDIFCLFEGNIENIPHLKQQYGLNKMANEVIIVIEAYRTLRDRGPYPADQVVRDIQGKFAFILFDSTDKAAFIAVLQMFVPSVSSIVYLQQTTDCPLFCLLSTFFEQKNVDTDGSVPFFWGTDSEERLVFSDDAEIVKKGCGKSFAPFPKGCFFTTAKGLQSYEHPLSEVKPVPRVDSQGQVCGATYKVDVETKRKEPSGMRKVDSAANWASQY